MPRRPYDLRQGLGYRLSLAARANSARFEDRLSALQLTRQMWCVLVAVGEQRICQPTEIASYIGIQKASASRSLRQMAEAGLIRFQPGQSDGRSRDVVLTEQGRRALDAAMEQAQASQSALAERFACDQDRADFERLLAQLLPEDGSALPQI